MDKDIVLNNAPWELFKIALVNAGLFLFVAVTVGSADLFFKTGSNAGLVIHLILSPVYFVLLSLFYFLACTCIFYLFQKWYFKDVLWIKVVMTYTCIFINTLVMYLFIKVNFGFSIQSFNQANFLIGFMLVFFTFFSSWSLIHMNKSIRCKRILKVSEREVDFWKESLDKKEYFG